ncbi:MAG: hypothetical protein MUF03_14470 [Rubrivivax sp.]|nr:hypothetical protein [Rubrivivax sp.]
MLRSPTRRALLPLILFAAIGWGAAPAAAQDIQWRQAHAFDRWEGNAFVRRGVAMFRIAGRLEPATLEIRGQLTGPQGDGWYGMKIDLLYRFDDGATLTGQLEGRFQRDAYGSASGAQEGAGTFTGGTGAAGLTVSGPGVLADVFGELSGTLSGLVPPAPAR